ncbi:hypothetical protein, partial [Paenibacillus cymbidii]|uniref:hypothetical protein n=1 Tax=Paenibacillus cymbidii TaxID=1639034 RepID=UPI001A9A7772
MWYDIKVAVKRKPTGKTLRDKMATSRQCLARLDFSGDTKLYHCPLKTEQRVSKQQRSSDRKLVFEEQVRTTFMESLILAQ